MFKESIYTDQYILTAPFYQYRDWYKSGKRHAGQDIGAKNKGSLHLKSSANGVLYDIKYLHKDYGNRIGIRINPKFMGGVDDNIVLSFSHLKSFSNIILKAVKGKIKFIPAESEVGIMGTTGTSTGVHLHYEAKQKDVKDGIETSIFKEIKSLINQGKINISLEDRYKKFSNREPSMSWDAVKNKSLLEYCWYRYQWGNLYIDPYVVHRYFQYLMEA